VENKLTITEAHLDHLGRQLYEVTGKGVSGIVRPFTYAEIKRYGQREINAWEPGAEAEYVVGVELAVSKVDERGNTFYGLAEGPEEFNSYEGSSSSSVYVRPLTINKIPLCGTGYCGVKDNGERRYMQSYAKRIDGGGDPTKTASSLVWELEWQFAQLLAGTPEQRREILADAIRTQIERVDQEALKAKDSAAAGRAFLGRVLDSTGQL
jgi:hypothetical protein